MNYALLDENNIVTNIIVLTPDAVEGFENAVFFGDTRVHIGDEYRDGLFYHEGERCYSTLEEAQIALQILTTGVSIDE